MIIVRDWISTDSSGNKLYALLMMRVVKGRNVVACFIGSGSMQSHLHASQGNPLQIFAIMLTAMGE
jgi:hypothetical protein